MMKLSRREFITAAAGLGAVCLTGEHGGRVLAAKTMETNVAVSAKDLILAPVPKKLASGKGSFDMGGKQYIRLDAKDVRPLVPAARQAGLAWEITASPKAPKDKVGLVIRVDESAGIVDEGYELRIDTDGMEIDASTPTGAFYGACTLAQIMRQCGQTVPCLSISDQPDYPNRGVMLDISRDKVPTMETLFRLVDLLASWKINQFQLYTEHTFAYLAHPAAWKDASPVTGEQILELDAYCKSRFVELVPNQNSFGHMERWLKHDQYRPMAEQPEGGDSVWGYRPDPFSLCPADERSIPFLEGLYEELLPHFASRLFNVGLDETADLGYGRSKEACEKLGTGRVYVDFLKQIHRLVENHGRTMMFWGDIVMNHPELIEDLPKNAIALEWGYEYDHPFSEHGKKFRDSGVAFYVCPGASNWGSLTGRTDNVIGNITSAAREGLANGAVGVLNTSWGDVGHWDPLPVAYAGFMAGAMASWNASADVEKTLAQSLSIHAFEDTTGKTGRAFYDLGNLYKCFEKQTPNCTLPWLMLFRDIDDPKVVECVRMDEFDKMQQRLEEIESSVKGDRMACADAGIVRSELGFLFDILRFSIDVGRVRLGGTNAAALTSRAEKIKDHHRRTWLLRNRPGGMEDSAAKLKVG